jgi:hypothetical protein
MNQNAIMNPLQQYFRRPAIYIKLPSGGQYYPPGVVNIPPNGELPVFPMTSIDEITIRTPDGLFNGAAVTSVIASCVPDIKDPWSLNSIDIDAVLIAIRAASSNGLMEVSSICPNCSTEGKFDLDLNILLSEKESIDYSTPLIVGDLRIVFKPLSYAEMNTVNMGQFTIQRMMAEIAKIEDEEEQKKVVANSLKQAATIANETLAKTIKTVITPGGDVSNYDFILEFINKTDSKTHDMIRDHSVKLRQANTNKPLKIKCHNCSHDYEQIMELDFSNFFG